MNARELHDNWIDYDDTNRGLLAMNDENGETILRAIDLLASVEESVDELVRGLREYACWQQDCGKDYRVILQAAARIVALEAENARLRGHAEAIKEAFFRSWAGDMSEEDFNELPCIVAYRAGKEAK